MNAMSRHTKTLLCCCEWVDGIRCDRFAKSLGRCWAHYLALKNENATEILRLHQMNFAERQADYERRRVTPPSSRLWEFEPTPEQVQELISMCGGNANGH
jgi:hypothetical protein